MDTKRGRTAATDDLKPSEKSMRKAAREAAREAIAAESRAIIDLVEAAALDAAAEASRNAGAAMTPQKRKAEQDAKPEKPGKGSKSGKRLKKGEGSKKGGKDGDGSKNAQPAKRSKRNRENTGDAVVPGEPNDHGRVEDDEGSVDFGRLRAEIDGVVQLVEQHRPEVRRAVFDSYVTAVIEFGASAKDLGVVDVSDRMLGVDEEKRIAEADAAGEEVLADVVVGPRRRSFEEPPTPPLRGPVREAEGLQRSSTAPRRARTSVNRGRSGVRVPAGQTETDATGGGATTEHEAPARIRRRRTATKTVPTLDELVAAAPPRNNDQRNLLIVQSHEFAGTPATLGAIEAGYERMGWRVPADLRVSLRLSMRRGLVLVGGDGVYRTV